MKELFLKCGVVLIKSFSNLYYLSGYANADAVILLFPDKKLYFTDARFTAEAAERLTGFEIIDSRADLFKAVKTHIPRGCRVGIEEELPLDFYNRLKSVVKRSFVYISDDMRRHRMKKSPEQLSLIREAQRITDQAFTDILPKIKEGMSERRLKRVVEDCLFDCGAEAVAFDSIVAFDEHSAFPHALATDKKLKKNSVIKLDFGARYAGYCADMTRTVFFGAPTAEQKEIYAAVLEAQRLALDGIRAGIGCRQAYDLANGYFAGRGLEKYFLHSLGHGIGTDVHEAPSLSPRSQQVLEENTVVSVEPGLYLPSKFGVRIEDIVIIRKSSAENLTKSQKQMIIL